MAPAAKAGSPDSLSLRGDRGQYLSPTLGTSRPLLPEKVRFVTSNGSRACLYVMKRQRSECQREALSPAGCAICYFSESVKWTESCLPCIFHSAVGGQPQ